MYHSGLLLHAWTKGYPDSVYESLAQHKVCVRHVHESFQENLSSHGRLEKGRVELVPAKPNNTL